MIDYLTHYYSIDKEPFQSLSALPDEEALKIMVELADDTPYGERFKNPAQYLQNRKATERWVRQAFIAKGGRPKDGYPIPTVLGSSQWLVESAPKREKHGEIRIPLSILTSEDVSFTYPDSMISRWFGRKKPGEFYQAELHGIVFTLPEILAIVAERGMPEEDWEIKLPKHLAPYIEAQVWNRELLLEYWRGLKT
ncbi:MAG: hypothetical protein WBG37_10290 [Desulfobacterales bacterium]